MRWNTSIARHTNHLSRLYLVVCVTVGLLMSCSPTFLYRHADRLLLWKIDEYVDLTSDQKRMVKDRIKALLARHRKEALPLYERFLIEIKDKSSDGLDHQEVDWIFSTYQQFRTDLFGRLVSDGGIVLSSMSDRQIAYLERQFQRDHEKAAGRMKEDQQARLAKRALTTLDWLKNWLGPLTKEQQQRIKALSMALPDLPAIGLEYQRDRQQQLIGFLRSTRDPDFISRYLESWLLRPERTAPPDYQRAVEQLNASLKDMTLDIDHFITMQQRAHALLELQHLIDEVHALAAAS